MEEMLWETMFKTADVLHWLGRYGECNALILFGRMLREQKIENLEQLERYVGNSTTDAARAITGESEINSSDAGGGK